MKRNIFSASIPVIELRAEGEKKAQVLTGYAAVFYRENDASTEYRYGDYVERILPGAFDAAIAEGQDVRALFNHELSAVLGRSKSGTLKLSADQTGLKYEVELPDTSLGRDVAELVRRGDISGSSFAFAVRPNGDNLTRDKQGVYIRSINSVDLFDVSPVTVPAYDGTSVQARDEAAAQLAALTAAEELAKTQEQEAEKQRQSDLALALQMAAIAR